jgi:hypothetical protein
VGEDQERHGSGSHVLSAVRYYTGIHDSNRRPDAHGAIARRLQAYAEQGIEVFPMPLRYDHRGRGREKGVDVRIAIDLTRLGCKGLYDVAVIVSEDSDLDPAVQDVYALRDSERWVAVENALLWTPTSHTQWLPSVRRRRPIDADLFEEVRDDHVYSGMRPGRSGPPVPCASFKNPSSRREATKDDQMTDSDETGVCDQAILQPRSGVESEPNALVRIWSARGCKTPKNDQNR